MTIDPTRARRARLDQGAVLQAAEVLVDRDGYDSLTMTSLAAEPDTRVSSLDHHVANLEDLPALVQVRATSVPWRARKPSSTSTESTSWSSAAP